jgi:hypothetical protein
VASDCARNAIFQAQLNAISRCNSRSAFCGRGHISDKELVFGEDATMYDPMIGPSTCTLCNTTHESYDKLREHQRMAHRGRSNEEEPQPAAVVEPSEHSEV